MTTTGNVVASGHNAGPGEPPGGPSSAQPVAASGHLVPERSPNTAELAVLQPHRNMAMWIICAALVGVTALTMLVSAHLGALALAGVLVAAGVVRVIMPGPVIGISVRSRPVDLVLYFGLAVAMVFLAQTAPNI